MICMGVLVRPLQLPCGSICCTTCMCDWVKHTPTIDLLSCPWCPLSHSVQISQLHPAPQVLMKLLDTLLCTCMRCRGRVPATQHTDHIESGCKLPPQESVPETIEDFLSRPPCTPLAPLEKKSHAALTPAPLLILITRVISFDSTNKWRSKSCR